MKLAVALSLILAASFTPLKAQQFETLAVVRELDEVEVLAQRDGLISELLVRRGHRVTPKQLIARLDKTDMTLRLNVVTLDVKRARIESQLLNELGDNAVYLGSSSSRRRPSSNSTANSPFGSSSKIASLRTSVAMSNGSYVLE